MKKALMLIFALSNTPYVLFGADRTITPVGGAVQIGPCVPQIAQVAQLAQKIAVAKLQEKNSVQEGKPFNGQTSSELIQLMRKQAERSVSKEHPLSTVYLRAHEQAVIAGDTDAAHILAIEKENSERGWYHKLISNNPKIVTAIEFAIPALVGFLVGSLIGGGEHSNQKDGNHCQNAKMVKAAEPNTQQLMG
jgi:hypothetical protein